MIRVMLLDDHPVVRAGLRAILNSFDGVHVTHEAADGSAVDGLVDGSITDVDVVVCDIQMPGVDGITATSKLAKAGGPPVLILTTYDTEADIVAALEAGALGYLLKDSPEARLFDAIIATHERKRTLSPDVAAALAQRTSQPQQSLSQREIEILRELATGAGNKALAKKLFISEATVKTHLIHIFQKLGVESRTAAVTAARDRRLI
ncbi:response regulator transcription factor [Corynebacterium pseudodiphtheriticum]|uniref:response regulator n=1 Tax=Corynebacterium pseudodiphtheriticum TaxID=37637 RepID=UPI002550782B|nr:response regulator transcription factor [Corynebacterium pseudodiphtheriticum]MDK8578575.1 response regulator transcription factor [Corynebacterium pseudodiphtheriticum]MDK8700473.1 response regulator transcription factor [Corynebacterium pseudodiphtheriticum]MDK8774504.1 response regulator transcription factor [Corynebacterium pseudodiphtheriticum]